MAFPRGELSGNSGPQEQGRGRLQGPPGQGHQGTLLRGQLHLLPTPGTWSPAHTGRCRGRRHCRAVTGKGLCRGRPFHGAESHQRCRPPGKASPGPAHCAQRRSAPSAPPLLEPSSLSGGLALPFLHLPAPPIQPSESPSCLSLWLPGPTGTLPPTLQLQELASC